MNFTHRITVLPKYLTVVLVLVLGAALTGCTQSQDDDDAPADLQETSEVEEYIPASADGPAQNVPEPRLPAAVAENTAEGAEAALEFFWEAAEYLRLTGDSNALALISDETCHYCESIILDWELLYEEGQWVVAPEKPSVSVQESRLRKQDDIDVADIFFSVAEPSVSLYRGANEVVAITDASEKTPWVALLVFQGTAQQWKIEWIGLERDIEWSDE